MAKGKRTPALFEIINRAQTQGQNPHLSVPGWWRSLSETAETDKNLSPPHPSEGVSGHHDPDPEHYDRVAEAVEQAAAAMPAPEAWTPDVEPVDAPPVDAIVDEPLPDDDVPLTEAPQEGVRSPMRAALGEFVHMESGRVHMSLGLIGGVIAGGGLLLLLSGSFAWGHALGRMAGKEEERRAIQKEVVDSVEQAREMRANPTVLEVGRRSTPAGKAWAAATANAPARASDPQPEAGATPPVTGSLRQVGWNYLVIQHFRGQHGREEAAKVRQYIMEQLPSIDGQPPVSIEQHSDGSHVLMSTMGYPPGDTAQREALDKFKERIRQIGKRYRQQGGGYDFRDAYPARYSQASKRR